MLAICDRTYEDDADLNLDHGFVLVPAPTPARTMFVYQYYNHDLRYHADALMWLQERQVAYQSMNSTQPPTPWHGDYQMGWGDMPQALIIRFDYAGRARLRTAVLLRGGPGLWQGRDYRHRRITLTLLDTYVRTGTGGEDDTWRLVHDSH